LLGSDLSVLCVLNCIAFREQIFMSKAANAAVALDDCDSWGEDNVASRWAAGYAEESVKTWVETNIVKPAQVQEAVGDFRPSQLCRERIPEAIDELQEIIQHTERSANDIMERAESLIDQATDDAIGILEACAFQDIVSQRVSKVLELLQMMEGRLQGLIEQSGVEDNPAMMREDEAKIEERREELMLHGPQLDGEGVNQDEIDALLDF
jgi:chemotaxis protein CheZ